MISTPTRFPDFFRLRQKFDAPRVEDIPSTVATSLTALRLDQRIEPGARVAITAGSRGIANMPAILKSIVAFFRELGAEPFIVPSMGSHGGGTAEGQLHVLHSYGITEEFCGCPILSSMETVVVCETEEGIPVHFDQNAFSADHVVVCNRVKPHTGFVGEIESGLMKMMLIGLGKRAGAQIYHQAIKDYSFGQIVRSVARHVLSQCRVLAGVAIVENGNEETALIEAVLPDRFEEREKELLRLAKQYMAKLPFDWADVLLVDEIGKNISGTGMDTNVIGRKYNDHVAREDETPKVRLIGIRNLSAATYGNALGIGLSEFCLRRVVEKMNAEVTAINSLTGGHPTGAMVPIQFETDRELLTAMLNNIGLLPPEKAGAIWIKNTLEVQEIACSAAYFEEAQKRPDLEVLSEPRPLPFGDDGMLPAYLDEAGF